MPTIAERELRLQKLILESIDFMKNFYQENSTKQISDLCNLNKYKYMFSLKIILFVHVAIEYQPLFKNLLNGFNQMQLKVFDSVKKIFLFNHICYFNPHYEVMCFPKKK